jgi:aspartyl aminopeptidase
MTAPDAHDLASFIDAAPSPRLAVQECVRRLEGSGFRRLQAGKRWEELQGGWYLPCAGSLLAGWEPAGVSPSTGFRLLGAHTDSPNLRLKPRPDSGRAGYRQLSIEVYGGALLNSWLDRSLGISGTAFLAGDEAPRPLDFRIDEPVLHLPQLAIHLNRELATEGLKLNAQQHLQPIFGLGDSREGTFREWLCERLGVDPSELLSLEVMTHDLTPSAVVGSSGEFLAAPRLDNLCSTWAATEALRAAAASNSPRAVLATLFDHEEVGSGSRTGAQGPHLRQVLERLVHQRGGDRQDLFAALADSACASADMAHAVHPNYADKHDPGHQVQLNGGPVIKINQNQRYATEGETQALFELACRTAEVPHQVWSMRADLACGSTIGPLTAMNLGIPTVDVGVPQLAMHSSREFAGSEDPARMVRALSAFCSL